MGLRMFDLRGLVQFGLGVTAAVMLQLQMLLCCWGALYWFSLLVAGLCETAMVSGLWLARQLLVWACGPCCLLSFLAFVVCCENWIMRTV